MNDSCKRYNVVVCNTLQQGFDQASASDKLTRLLKITPEKAQQLLSRKNTVVKKAVDKNTALHYQKVIQKTGVTVKILPAKQNSNNDARLDENKKAVPSTVSETPQSTAVKNKTVAQSVACKDCGKEIDTDSDHCACSVKAKQKSYPKSKNKAALLALLFGGLGIHRFYLGQWWGIFYLLTWPISSLISIVESIIFVTTSSDQWQNKYGNVTQRQITRAMLVGLISLLLLLGVLASAAFLVYHTYNIKARLEASMPFINTQLAHIESIVKTTGFIPSQNLDAGFPDDFSQGDVESFVVRKGGIVEITFSADALGERSKTLLFKPNWINRKANWHCAGGSLPKLQQPASCDDMARANDKTASATEARTITSSEGRFSILLREGWSETDQMHDDASLQAQNVKRNEYLIIFEESRDGFESSLSLADYCAIISEQMLQRLGPGAFSAPPKQVSIGTTPAIAQEVNGVIGGLNISYLIGCVESNRYFYQLLFWAESSRMAESRKNFENMFNSFKAEKIEVDSN